MNSFILHVLLCRSDPDECYYMNCPGVILMSVILHELSRSDPDDCCIVQDVILMSICLRFIICN